MTDTTTLLCRIESVIERLEAISQKAEDDRAWSSAIAAIREVRGCLTLLAQLRGDLQSQTSTNISVSVVSQRIEASILAASPGEFAEFWKRLLEKASQEQKDAAIAVTPPGGCPDLSMLTDEELDLLERLTTKVQR